MSVTPFRLTENRTTETARILSAAPNVLSDAQKKTFIQLIKDNPPEFRNEIEELKKRYPDDLGNVESFNDSQISDFNNTDTTKLQSRLENYKKIATPDVTPISSTTGNLVVAADPSNDRFVE